MIVIVLIGLIGVLSWSTAPTLAVVLWVLAGSLLVASGLGRTLGAVEAQRDE